MIIKVGFLRRRAMLELMQNQKKLNQNLMNIEVRLETVIVLEKNLEMLLKIIRRALIIQ